MGIYGGILSVQGCEYLGDGLGEDAGVWMDHAREVFVFYCLLDLALQCGFNEIDIVELSDALFMDVTKVGDLRRCQSCVIGDGWLGWANVWEIGCYDFDGGCIMDEAEVSHGAIAEG